MVCTIHMYLAKTKALISYAVTAQLICAFVFTYAKIRFSHDTAHIYSSFVTPGTSFITTTAAELEQGKNMCWEPVV